MTQGNLSYVLLPLYLYVHNIKKPWTKITGSTRISSCTQYVERGLKNHMKSEHSISAHSVSLVDEYEEELPSDDQCAEICRMLKEYSSDSYN